MKTKTFILSTCLVLILGILTVYFPACNKRIQPEEITAAGKAPANLTNSARLADNPGNIFVGAAYKMIDMTKPNTKGWQIIRDYGVGLHVHPVDWRLAGWSVLGVPISNMLINKSFTYEFDIRDVIDHSWDNMAEVNSVRSFGLTCARVMCNVSAKQLDIDPDLPEYLLDNVVKPFNDSSIAVDILFSPVSGDAFDSVNNRRHIDWLLENDRWINLLFDQAHAQDVAIDFPPNYWVDGQVYRDALIPFLTQAKANNKEVTLMVNLDNKGNCKTSSLNTMYEDLKELDLLPARWVVNNFNNDTLSPVPEKKLDCTLSDNPAGAALLLCKKTGVPEPEELFVPDETKYYKIVGLQSNKCIDVSNISTQNNAPVWIWSYINGDNQQWKFVSHANGYYKIISKNSGMCLSTISQSTANGINLVQQTDNNTSNQLWKLVHECNGIYKIINLYSGKCIDVQGYSTTDGGNIWQYEYLNTDNQKWLLTETGNIP